MTNIDVLPEMLYSPLQCITNHIITLYRKDVGQSTGTCKNILFYGFYYSSTNIHVHSYTSTCGPIAKNVEYDKNKVECSRFKKGIISKIK